MKTLRQCILELRENPCMSPQYGEMVADEMLAILDNAEWELDGWQQDYIPNRVIPDPDTFTLGGPHAPKGDE